MKQILMLFSLMTVLVLYSTSAYAVDVSFIFGATGETQIYNNASHTTEMTLNAFHGASETWAFFIENNPSDNTPYDNQTWYLSCSNGEEATFSTLDYQTWIDDGYIQIVFDFNDEEETIYYNSVPLEAKTVSCDFTLRYINASNNTADYTMDVEMIPYYITTEFVDCTAYSYNPTLSITSFIDTTIGFMSSSWEIAWIIFSIGAILFTLIGVPIFAFLVIRWAIFKITGKKLIERKEYD